MMISQLTTSSMRAYDAVLIPLVDDPEGPGHKELLHNDFDAYPTGNELSREQTYYDIRGRVRFTVNGATGLITEFEYDPQGRQRASVQYLTGVYDTAAG